MRYKIKSKNGGNKQSKQIPGMDNRPETIKKNKNIGVQQ